MIEPAFAAVTAIVFFAFFTQAATGFGAMLIALTLGALFYPVTLLLSWFVPLVALLSVYLLARHRDHIAWRLFLRSLLPAMGAGLVLGQLLYYALDVDRLKTALGVLVIVLALRELWRRPGAGGKVPLLPWTGAAGVVHGLFATGGPLLVYALNGQQLPKAAFRSTLALVWLIMAIALSGSYIATGQLGLHSLPQIGWLAATLPFSIVLGEWAHRHIDEQRFRTLINVLLVFCGAALLR